MKKFTNEDCMDLMARHEDKHFDLAIVDPPYGIDAGEMKMGKGKKDWLSSAWDKCTPSDKYFFELFRVSKKQIIWGGNYFGLPISAGWIYWNKIRLKDISFSDGELAWTNFLNVLKQIDLKYDGFLGRDNVRIHPTQKPIALYKQLLYKYAKYGDLILDTHVGSASSLIACEEMGFSYEGCELDADYYKTACERIELYRAQGKLELEVSNEP
jgi:site-specific DNA-methyltransferase (adenine-specific)